MIKLQTKEVKDFLNKGKFISKSKIIPILDYLKLTYSEGKGVITKSNMNEFIVASISVSAKESGEILILENVLSSFLSSIRSSEITIVVDGNKLVISADKSKVSCPTDDAINFPKTPERDYMDESKSSVITKEMIDAIGLVNSTVAKQETLTWKNFIMLHKGLIVGSDGYSGHMVRFSQLTEQLISAQAASAIMQHNSVQTFCSNNYVFYKDEDIEYGFLKTETKPQDITSYFRERMPDSEFTFSRKELMDFCQLTLSSLGNKTHFIMCAIKIKEGVLEVLTEPNEYSIDVKKQIDYVGIKDAEDFMFNPVTFLRLLSPLSEEEITCFYAMSCLWIKTSDDNYCGFATKLSPVNQN